MIKMMRVSLFQASGGEEDGRRTHGTGCQPSPPGWAIHQMSSTATSNQNVSRRVKNSPKDSRESLAPPASWRRATCLGSCWRAREGGWLHLDKWTWWFGEGDDGAFEDDGEDKEVGDLDQAWRIAAGWQGFGGYQKTKSSKPGEIFGIKIEKTR